MKTTILFFCLIFGISTSTWGSVTVEEEENHLEIHQTWKEIVDSTSISIPTWADVEADVDKNPLEPLDSWIEEEDKNPLEPLYSWKEEDKNPLEPLYSWKEEEDKNPLEPLDSWKEEEDKNPLEPLYSWKEEEKGRGGNVECSSIFQPVGGHCLFVDESLSLPWQSTRDACVALGGDLPNLKDGNFLADINDFLHENHLDNVSYWVGSTDESTEGEWYWISDQSLVKMGTPLWGDFADGIQQPTGGIAENCGVLLQVDHYFMHDADCNESHTLLCEQFQSTEVEGTSKNATSTWISNNKSNTYNSAECLFPYEMVYGECIFINTLAVKSWYDQKTFCEGLGGHMIQLDDANFLGALYDHLLERGINATFWIGASDEEQEGDWSWPDKSQVRLGTPFWGDDDDEIQEPDGGTRQNCADVCYEKHYHFGDFYCDELRPVICQLDI